MSSAVRRRAGRRGFGLLEVILASTLVLVTVTAYLRLQTFVVKGSQAALDVSALTRAMMLVRADLLRDDRFLPPQEIPPGADPSDPRSLDRFLDDPVYSAGRCYARAGTEVAPVASINDCKSNKATFFVVRFAKFRQPDLSFYDNDENPAARPDNELNRIPLGHYRIRVEYSPDSGKSTKRVFLSQYVTSTIVY